MRNPFRRPPQRVRQVLPYEGRELLERESLASSSTLEDQVGAFWATMGGTTFNQAMIDKVWSANRCIQLNSQQVASMPIRFFGTREPAWVSNPDPVWYPNGIQDAIFAAVKSYYGFGDAFVYVTARYADGFPSAWTVLDPAPINVTIAGGQRQYKSGDRILDPDNMVQISRNPSGLRGVSALSSYGANMLASIAAADLGRSIMDSGIPTTVLKSERKLTPEQAEAIQTQWMERTTQRRGAPAVLPPELSFEALSFSPKDLLLLDGQQFNARVIAAAFGVPPILINLPIEASLTYQSAAPLFEVWWRSELRPVSKQICAALSANMLPRGSWVEADAQDVLAPSFADEVEAWSKMVAGNVVTIDEFRAAVLKLPPQTPEESVADLLVPPNSAANNNQEAANVTQLRPAQGGQ